MYRSWWTVLRQYPVLKAQKIGEHARSVENNFFIVICRLDACKLVSVHKNLSMVQEFRIMHVPSKGREGK